MSWRWEWDNALHGMIEKIDAMRKTQDQDMLRPADESLRSFWSRLPDHLKWRGNVPGSDRLETKALQQARIALHYNTGLLQLHRLPFSKALKLHSAEPLDSRYQVSVVTVINEACPNVLSLVDALYRRDPVSTRHMVSPPCHSNRV